MKGNILFLCPHHAAKSVIAAAYFNRLAGERGLNVTADSAGTDPDEKVSPVVVSMLAAEGIDVSRHVPRHVRPDDLQSADRIISMGCTAEELGIAPERIEFWRDVPAVSQQPDDAREAIRRHVEQFIAEIEAP